MSGVQESLKFFNVAERKIHQVSEGEPITIKLDDLNKGDFVFSFRGFNKRIVVNPNSQAIRIGDDELRGVGAKKDFPAHQNFQVSGNFDEGTQGYPIEKNFSYNFEPSFQFEITNEGLKITSNIPDFHNLKTKIRNDRESCVPQIPRGINEYGIQITFPTKDQKYLPELGYVSVGKIEKQNFNDFVGRALTVKKDMVSDWRPVELTLPNNEKITITRKGLVFQAKYDGRDFIFDASSGKFSVGRDFGSNIIILDTPQNNYVSREHLKMSVDFEGNLVIKDTSSNGTKISYYTETT